MVATICNNIAIQQGNTIFLTMLSPFNKKKKKNEGGGGRRDWSQVHGGIHDQPPAGDWLLAGCLEKGSILTPCCTMLFSALFLPVYPQERVDSLNKKGRFLTFHSFLNSTMQRPTPTYGAGARAAQPGSPQARPRVGYQAPAYGRGPAAIGAGVSVQARPVGAGGVAGYGRPSAAAQGASSAGAPRASPAGGYTSPTRAGAATTPGAGAGAYQRPAATGGVAPRAGTSATATPIRTAQPRVAVTPVARPAAAGVAPQVRPNPANARAAGATATTGMLSAQYRPPPTAANAPKLAAARTAVAPQQTRPQMVPPIQTQTIGQSQGIDVSKPSSARGHLKRDNAQGQWKMSTPSEQKVSDAVQSCFMLIAMWLLCPCLCLCLSLCCVVILCVVVAVVVLVVLSVLFPVSAFVFVFVFAVIMLWGMAWCGVVWCVHRWQHKLHPTQIAKDHIHFKFVVILL